MGQRYEPWRITETGASGVEAHAGAAAALIAIGPGIAVQAANASASVTCVGGAPVLASGSDVVKLQGGGSPVRVPAAHTNIPIPLVGTLHLHETIPGPNSVTQRAVWLETPSAAIPDAVVGEAHADFTGDPCP